MSIRILPEQMREHNDRLLEKHNRYFNLLTDKLTEEGQDVEQLLADLRDFQIAIPSWALGAGGTRFGRFQIGGEPRNLYEKIDDVAMIHTLTGSADSISLHIPWDIPDDAGAIIRHASGAGIAFDSVNSNTFQDQKGQKESYKFGSLAHTQKSVRDRAIEHNIQVVEYGRALDAKILTVWLADGSNFPGQVHLRKSFEYTLDSLQKIYKHMPDDFIMLIEYKPYEPNFYSMVIQDWGSSLLLATKTGDRCYSLVDLGHHLPNTNIEQIVSRLMMEEKLGGFHFNDSKYGDDDLTVGSIKPYQLFLIFNELVDGMRDPSCKNRTPAWMIDASHNVKDPLEDLIQSIEAIILAYAQALIVKRDTLGSAQESNDVTEAQEVLQDAFRTDVRPLLAEARLRAQHALYPLGLYRDLGIRQSLIQKRGEHSVATGL
jgi:L-rhamnose isomerase / sugar isomerase